MPPSLPLAASIGAEKSVAPGMGRCFSRGKRMKFLVRIAPGAALAAVTAGGALAADLPRRTVAPAAPAYIAPPLFTWTGFYAGLNAGATIGDTRYQYAPFFNNYAQSGVGFTGGGQIGYNFQTGPVVIGLETDINYRGGSSSSSNWAYGGANSSSGYFGTIRGRLGFTPMDRLLIYGTGGIAYGSTSFPNTIAGIDGFGVPRAFYGQNNQGTKFGWTAGAGAEYAITPKWSVKAEYLYVDLGKSYVNYYDAASGAVLPASARNANHVVRLGVNYHF